jgi:CRP-like cAMP-binding protein
MNADGIGPSNAGPYQAAEELVRTMAGAGQTLRLERGDRLFSFGEAAQGVYVLTSGKAQARFPGEVGRELMCLTVSAGAVLGLPAALCANRYQFHVEAIEEVEAVFLATAAVNEILRERPELGLQVMGIMCNEMASLRQTREQMQSCAKQGCSLHGVCSQKPE